MTLYEFFSLLGGVGLFLYGMTIMSTGLRNACGEKLKTILEYAIICLPVTLFALLVWRELSPMTVIGVWLAFMAGAMCTIVRFSMIPLVKQIRELEE